MDIIQCNLLVKTKRKWKSRWVVLRRVNPASERINLYVYKDRMSAISKHREKLFFPLREFCGMESVDKENKFPKLVIITATQPLSLRFEKKEDRDHWIDTIVTEGSFGEDVSFDGIVPNKQALKSGEVTLHIYPDFFTLIRKQNSRCLGRWKFEQLFNYGVVDGGFVFQVENETETSSEPESFLLLTSFEKQINRTFDTVYKTARSMYGSVDHPCPAACSRRTRSFGLIRHVRECDVKTARVSVDEEEEATSAIAEAQPGKFRNSSRNIMRKKRCNQGLQRRPKLNSPSGPRPRSMSEPSGFKRFMHRLSFRRKSRRPKNPKWKTDSFNRRLGVEAENTSAAQLRKGSDLSGEGSGQDFPENHATEPSLKILRSTSIPEGEYGSGANSPGAASVTGSSSPRLEVGSVLGDVGQNKSDDPIRGAQDSEKRSNTERRQTNTTGQARNSEGKTRQSPGSQQNSTRIKQEVVANGVSEPSRDSGNARTKPSQEMKESLSTGDVKTLGYQGTSEDDLKVWQRRSAMLLNTDDMIEQGFIKTKSTELRSNAGDSKAGDVKGNDSTKSDASVNQPDQGAAAQVRRNTTGSRRKKPNLTIEITPSGSDPALNQYVNISQPVKSKQLYKLKQGEWGQYDSDENVYHRLEAIVGPPGYENVPKAKSQSVNSLDTSYRNLPGTYPNGGHSYENVSGVPGGTRSMHYVNIQATKPQNVNYIKVEGSGPPTPISTDSNHSPNSRKHNANTDYTEIDVEKTKQLRELAEQIKKPLERVKKA